MMTRYVKHAFQFKDIPWGQGCDTPPGLPSLRMLPDNPFCRGASRFGRRCGDRRTTCRACLNGHAFPPPLAALPLHDAVPSSHVRQEGATAREPPRQPSQHLFIIAALKTFRIQNAGHLH